MADHLSQALGLTKKVSNLLLSRLSPRDRNTWVFIAGNGSRFAENSKYLFLRAADHEEIHPVWIGTSDEVIEMLRSEGYQAYNRYSVEGRLKLLRAGVAIVTHGPQFGQLLGGACVVDTHHGNALKTMGADKKNAPETTSWSKLKQLGNDLLMKRSYFLVTSRGPPLNTFKKAKGLDDSEIIVAPYPRLDPLIFDDEKFELGTNEDALRKIRNESEKKTLVFYTPTWRRAFGESNGKPLSEIKPDFGEIDSELSEEEFKIYVSAHPREPLGIAYDDYSTVDRLESGGDLYPFLRYCDVLITDYSSIFYDYSLTDNPMIFYAPDLQEYEETRGLYFDYHRHVPGPVARTTQDLITYVQESDVQPDSLVRKRDHIRDKFYGGTPSNPSQIALERILDRI